MMHLQSSTQPRQAAVFFILVTVVLDMLSFGIIIPVLPKLLEEFLGGDTAQAAEIYGLMGTSWALMQFVLFDLDICQQDKRFDTAICMAQLDPFKVYDEIENQYERWKHGAYIGV